MFMVDNMTDDRAGHLVCGYRRHGDTNIWALYPLSDSTLNDAEIIQNTRDDLKAVGATLGHIHRHDKWDFYPHVSPEDFQLASTRPWRHIKVSDEPTLRVKSWAPQP